MGNSEAELLPCPFCGGEAKRLTLTEEDEPGSAGGDVITCTRCQASSHVEFGRKENLVDRWNTRASEQTADTGAGDGTFVARLWSMSVALRQQGDVNAADYLRQASDEIARLRAKLTTAKPLKDNSQC